MGYKKGIGIIYGDLGDDYAKIRKFKAAKTCLDSAMALGKDIGIRDLIRDTYCCYYYYDSLIHDYKKSLADYKMYIVYRDSLINSETDKKILSQQLVYGFKLQQDSIKHDEEYKESIAANNKRKQESIIATVSIGLGLVLVFTVILFYRFRIIKRQKYVIEEQKKLVEKQKEAVEQQNILVEQQKTEVERKNAVIAEKNKDILDSINYAKRLQDAILPSMTDIRQYFPESFIIYKPKDIVAGDFYWLAPIPA